jgi:NAD(P)H-hydrate epimerase
MIVLTSEQMAYLDRETIARGIPGIELMRNAGAAVHERLIEEFDSLSEQHVVIAAGKGNNGGDGFRVAENLASCGVRCSVFLIGKRSEVRGDALACLHAAEDAGAKVYEIANDDDLSRYSAIFLSAGIYVDALFGTGLKGEISGRAAILIGFMNDSDAPIVSVDIPSGVNATTSEVSNHTVRADYTVTFGCLKAGHVFQPGRRNSGRVRVAEIGFSREVMESLEPFGHALTPEEAANLLPKRPWNAHKNSAGRVFVIAGSAGMTGAAALASEAALRSGAGIVRVGCPSSLNDILEVKLTEALTVPLPEVRKKRCLSLRAMGELRKTASASDAVAVGPGLGTYFETAELIRRFVSRYEGKVVLDADGINAFRGARDALAAAACELVLTPHAGELSRLMETPSADIAAHPIESARRAALELGKIVLLKGPNTVIADPSGRVWLNPTGCEALATAGSGDVLTGLVAGFAAQGLDLLHAAALGAYVHGLCGEIAEEYVGKRGVIAGDLVDVISDACNRIETARGSM